MGDFLHPSIGTGGVNGAHRSVGCEAYELLQNFESGRAWIPDISTESEIPGWRMWSGGSDVVIVGGLGATGDQPSICLVDKNSCAPTPAPKSPLRCGL